MTSELPWFDGDAESIDVFLSLIGSYRADSLLVAIERALDSKVGTLTEAEEDVLAVEALEREVNNGGFHQFFINAAETVPRVVDALNRARCRSVAQITSDAIVALGLDAGVTTQAVREAVAALAPTGMDRLGQLDKQFHAYPDPIDERLLAYISEHRHEIAWP